MNFEKEIQYFKKMGELLNEFDYEKNGLEATISFILFVETELWRTRINIEYKLSQK